MNCNNPAILTFDVVAFRSLFPAFVNQITYPTSVLQMYWDTATCYISDIGNFGSLQGSCRQLAINYMTAHLLAIAGIVANGQVPSIVDSATIDKISVGLMDPPVKNQWQWWLSTTPYGQQLLALLQNRSVGGFYIGGLPELSAFRRVGGGFGNNGLGGNNGI